MMEEEETAHVETYWCDQLSTQLCRLCANSDYCMLPIFEGDGVEQEIEMKIHKYLPIEVSKKDAVAIHICYSCSSTLNAWHLLYQNALVADEKLKKMVSRICKKQGGESESTSDTTEPRKQTKDEPETITDGKDILSSGSRSKESSVNSILYIQNYLEPNKWFEYMRRNAVNSISEELPSVVKHEHEIQLEETTYEFPEIAAEEEYGQETRLYDNEELRVTKSIGSVCDSTIVAKKEMSQSIIDVLIDIDSKTKLNVNNFNTGLNSVNENSTKDTMTIPMLQQAPTGFTEEIKQSFMELELLVMSSEEKEADFYCKLCEAYFPDNLMLTSHKNTSHITVKLKCQFCDIQFENSNQLNEHKKIHSNILIECPVCGKMVHKGSGFKQHFLLHRDLNLHVCYKCGQVLPNETELEFHKYLDHKVKNCLCETCGKVFKNKYTLSNHIKNHLGQAHIQKLKCGLCELWVSSRANLRHHTLTHNIFRERKHACDQCDKKFFYPHNLRAHVLVHFEDRPFKCTSCNKAFKWKKNLDLHMKTHLIVTDEPNKPVLKIAENTIHLCQICGKTLLSKTSLYTHLKSHDGSLKTICEICGKILSNSHVMRYHLDYHKRIDDAKSFSSESSPASV